MNGALSHDRKIGPHFTIASVWSGTWSAYAAHPFFFLSMCALATIPRLVEIYMALRLLPLKAIMTGVGDLAHYFFCLGVIACATVNTLDGRRHTVSDALGEYRGSLVTLLCFVVFHRLFDFALPVFFEGRSTVELVHYLVMVFFLTLILYVFFGVYFGVAVQAVAVEGLGFVASLMRSRGLVRGHWWKLFVLYIMRFAVLSVVIPIISLAITGRDSPYHLLVRYLISFAPESYFCVMWAVVYRNLRIEREGVPPEKIASVFT